MLENESQDVNQHAGNMQNALKLPAALTRVQRQITISMDVHAMVCFI